MFDPLSFRATQICALLCLIGVSSLQAADRDLSSIKANLRTDQKVLSDCLEQAKENLAVCRRLKEEKRKCLAIEIEEKQACKNLAVVDDSWENLE